MISGESAGHLHALVAELLHRPVQLLEFDRLFDHRHWAYLEDFAQNLAVRIAGDNHDRQVRMQFLQTLIDFVSRDIGQLQVEEYEVELLLLGEGNGFRAAAGTRKTSVFDSWS